MAKKMTKDEAIDVYLEIMSQAAKVVIDNELLVIGGPEETRVPFQYKGSNYFISLYVDYDRDTGSVH